MGEAWLGWAGWVTEINGMFISGTLLSRLTNHTSPTTNLWTRLEYSHQKWIPKFFSCHVILSGFIVFVCAVVLHQSFFFVVGIWNLDT